MSEREPVKNYWPGIILFCLTLIVGLFIYKDYGISWDEPPQHGLGKVTYNYVFNGDNTLKKYDDRGLGSGFELPLMMLEKNLHQVNERDIYLTRHLVTHIFFLLGVFCGYVLAYRLFGSQFIACLAFIMLAFHPRIYAHSFFNTKDIPFLATVLMLMLATQVAFQKDKWGWYLLAGVASGYATSIRAMGILFAVVITYFFIVDFFRTVTRKGNVAAALLNTACFIGGFCGTLYLCWPYLWGNPVDNFVESFTNLSNIVWSGRVLFEGVSYAGNMLPLSYMPTWFSITVPELWLIAGVAGCIWVAIDFLRKPSRFIENTRERNFLLYLVGFLAPAAAMMIFHGVNIDDWRHLYFIYPSFVMLALLVISKLAVSGRKTIAVTLCALQVALVGFFMIRNHPFQQVYFNNLVSHRPEYLRTHFDLEYWGCSYKQGVDYILAHDTSSIIRMTDWPEPDANALRFLPAKQAARIEKLYNGERPDYYLTNFRMHPRDYPYPNVFYEIKVLNSTIMRVYKLKP